MTADHRRIGRIEARVILVALAALLIAGLTTVPPKDRPEPRNQGDLGLFTAVVRRVQNGETYYPAMGAELRSRTYPTASVFNWRMPLVLRAVAARPRVARIIFLLLTATALAATVAVLLKGPPEVLLVSLLAQIAVAIPLLAVREYTLMSEAWAGLLIVLSVAAYARLWWIAAAVLGVMALFVRELAAPYCVACGILAVVNRRWREVAVWTVGAVLFAFYFAEHVSLVQEQIRSDDATHRQSWIQFGGLPFVFRTIAFTGWYDTLPARAPAIGAVLLVASLWAASAWLHLRVAVVAFLAFFAVIGQPFNQYWGLVPGPAWAMAYGFGVAGLWRLVSASVRGEGKRLALS